MKRFLSVGRWDMTINKKFYLSQVASLLVLAVTPVVFQYLLWWSSGRISILDFSGSAGDPSIVQNTLDLGLFYMIITNFIPIIYFGYMFHNLLRKQGRIAELTLPASNVERFLWHALFSLFAPLLVFGCCVVCADIVNLLFALLFGCLPMVSSLTCSWFGSLADMLPKRFCSGLDCSCWMFAFMTLSSLCYVSTFALGNAIKYRYNIILTWLAHMLFWMVLGLGAMFTFGLLLQVFGRECFSHMVIDININEPLWLALGCVFMLILLIGIWALTYWLYCKAQITTRRNR
ncbi:MAG: hypothetical protein ACI4B5_08260 [Bacteroidaceae bacterium]